MSDYGHFTTMRRESDGVRGWGRHLDRLHRDGARLFDAPASSERILASIPPFAEPCVLRIAVTADPVDLANPGAGRVRVSTTVRPPLVDPAPLRVQPVEHRRSLAGVKHVAITPELEVRRRARSAGFDDAVFTEDGRIGEGPTWSIVFVAGDRIVVPNGDVLASVTVALLGQVETDEIRDVSGFDGAFAANAGWGLRPISAIGEHTFGPPTPAMRALPERYAALPREPITAGI